LNDKIVSVYSITELCKGDNFSFEELIDSDMVNNFALLVGDYSPLHMDNRFAKSRRFNGRVIHGVLLLGLLSRLIGMHLPGENALIISMNSQFIVPAYIGDKVRVYAEVDQISLDIKVIVLNAKIERSPDFSRALVRSKIMVKFTN
jgi:acyl dehydratase